MLGVFKKVEQREQNLIEVQGDADELLLEAQRFKKIAHKTEKKMMWKNVKLWAILICVIATIVIVLLVIIGGVVCFKKC